jgi:tetratricopeptide (TPR) repeat protein
MAAFDKRKALQNALTYTQQGKWDKAIKEYQDILKADPKDLTVCNNLGDLFARAGRPAEAIEQYGKLGDQYRADGLAVKAIAVYKKIIKLDSNWTAAYLACADLYQDQGLIGEAKVQLQTVADHYARAGDTAKVIEIYQRMTQLDPSSHALLSKLADLLLADGKREAAAAEYDRAAEAAQAAGHIAESKRLFQKARDLMPESPEANLGLGEVHLREGRVAEAMDLLTKVTAANPNNARAWSLLGEANARLDQAPEAVEAFARAIALGTPQGEVRRPYAMALVQAGRPDEALVLCQEFTESALGEGEPDQAVQFCRELLAVAPNATVIHAHLVTLLQGLGQDEEARSASWSWAAAHETLGETQAAIRVYRQLLERDPSDAEAQARLEVLEGAPETGQAPADVGEPVLLLETSSEATPPPGWQEEGAPTLPPAAVLETEGALAPEGPPPQVLEPAKAGEAAGIPFPSVEGSIEFRPEAFEPVDASTRREEASAPLSEEAGGIEMPLLLEGESVPGPPGPEAGEEPTSQAPEVGLQETGAPLDFLPAEDAGVGGGILSEVAMTETMPPEEGSVGPAPEEPAQPEALVMTEGPAFEFPPDRGGQEGGPEGADLPPVLDVMPMEAPAPPQVEEELPPELRMLLEESTEEPVLVVEGGEADLDQSMTDDLAEAEFYLSQGMVQEAGVVHRRMRDRNPDHAAVAHLGTLLEGQAAPSPPGTEPRVETAAPQEAPVAGAQVLSPHMPPSPDSLAATFEALAEELAAEPISEEALPPVETAAPPPAPAERLQPPPEFPPETRGEGTPPAGLRSADAEPVVPKFTVMDTQGHAGADFVNLGAELEEEMAAEERTTAVTAGAPAMGDLLREFQKGVREHLDEKDFETHYNLGIAYKEMELLDEAIQEFRLAARDPSRALACADLLAVCYLAKGQPDHAIQELVAGLAVSGHPREAYHSLRYNLGIAYEKQGDLDQALEQFEALLAEDIRFRDVRARVQGLLERLQRPLAPSVPPPPAPAAEAPGPPKEKKKKISFI